MICAVYFPILRKYLEVVNSVEIQFQWRERRLDQCQGTCGETGDNSDAGSLTDVTLYT
jgi:hypothetical protein